MILAWTWIYTSTDVSQFSGFCVLSQFLSSQLCLTYSKLHDHGRGNHICITYAIDRRHQKLEEEKVPTLLSGRHHLFEEPSTVTEIVTKLNFMRNFWCRFIRKYLSLDKTDRRVKLWFLHQAAAGVRYLCGKQTCSSGVRWLSLGGDQILSYNNHPSIKNPVLLPIRTSLYSQLVCQSKWAKLAPFIHPFLDRNVCGSRMGTRAPIPNPCLKSVHWSSTGLDPVRHDTSVNPVRRASTFF